MFVKISKIKFLKILILFSTLFLSCRNKNDVKIDSSNLSVVKTVKIENRKLNDDLNSFGTISYKTKNNVCVLVEGTLEKLYVKEGDYVSEGQKLAKLRNVQLEIQKEQAENSLEAAKVALYQAEINLQEEKLNVESRLISLEKSAYSLEQAKLELEEAKTNLENNRQLLDVGGITESSFRSMEISLKSKETDCIVKEKEMEISKLGLRDEDLIANGFVISANQEEKKNQFIELNTRNAFANVKTQKAQVSSSEKNLTSIEKLIDELNIKAPVSGIVGILYFENGEYVPENEKLLTLMDISEVNAVFSIQEQDIQFFHIGDFLTVNLPSINKSFNTKISEISPIADSTSGNFTVKALLPNKDTIIKPGMFVKCSVQRNEKKIYPCIPETAIINKEGEKAFVFVVVKGFLVIKEISIKTQKDGYVWIESGLKDSDILVNKPSPFLREGEKVEIH